MGLLDYLGWTWKSKVRIPIVCVSGSPVQPDNRMETVLYLLYMSMSLYVGWQGTHDPPRRRAAPDLILGSTVHEGCDRGGCYEQAWRESPHRP